MVVVKLLVAALASEISAFPVSIPGFDRLVTGPGKLNAAVGLTRALAHRPVEDIVVVGTAGALGPNVAPGVHDVSAAIQHDVTDLAGVRGKHVSLPERLETGHSGLVIATGDSFVDDADAVRQIIELGADLVDMESYALIWVAQQQQVPIRILRAISDTAQDGATTTWDDTVAACSAELWASFRHEYRLGD